MRAAVSLIVVSQKRPSELERLLGALIYQSLVNFEIIIVADELRRTPLNLKQHIKFIEFKELNISKARNIGISASRAPIIAFCDDDATPDPYWLERIIRPFYKHDIGATTGFVRGRNGISYQWKAVEFDRKGKDTDLAMKVGADNKVIKPRVNKFVKTVGTNCAFRRDALHKVGGYDEAFFYYLDDADINLRLQEAGYSTGIIPKAELIHSYFESRGRASNRVPKTLYNLGASTRHFLHQHYKSDHSLVLEKFETDQRQRLIEFFNYGLMRGRQVPALMRDLRRGIDAGANRKAVMPLKSIRQPKLAEMVLRPLTINIATTMPPPAPDSVIPVQIKLEHTVRAASFQFTEGRWLLRTGRFGRFNRNEPWWSYRTSKKALARAEKFIHDRFLPN